MVTIIQRQRVWEIHEFELTEGQYKIFKGIPITEKEEFLSNLGGTPAEYECDLHFKYEVRK